MKHPCQKAVQQHLLDRSLGSTPHLRTELPYLTCFAADNQMSGAGGGGARIFGRIEKNGNLGHSLSLSLIMAAARGTSLGCAPPTPRAK